MPFDLKEAYIIKAEQDLNILKFPEHYRQFMMRSNGDFYHVLGFDLYPIADLSDSKRIKRTCNHVVRETLNIRKNDPSGDCDNSIIIGDDGGRGIYFFKINADRSVDDYVWYRTYDQTDCEAERLCQFRMSQG